MIDTFYVLESEAQGCDVEILLNRIPIVLRGPKHGNFFSAPVNQYMVDGMNEIALVVRPGAVPSESWTGPFGPKLPLAPEKGERAWARIARYPQGAIAGGPDATELLRVEWPRKDARVLGVAPTIAPSYRARGLPFDDHHLSDFPVVTWKRGNFGRMFGRWRWQDAPVLELGDALVAEVREVLEGVRTGLARGDADPYLAAKGIALSETADAYDEPAGIKRNFIASDAVRTALKPDFKLEPINAAQFDLRLVAGGRIVECIAKDWQPILRTKPGADGVLYYPFFLARIEGTLQGAR